MTTRFVRLKVVAVAATVGAISAGGVLLVPALVAAEDRRHSDQRGAEQF